MTEALPGLGQVASLISDPREVEVRAVADGLGHRTCQQALEDPARLGVQAKREVEPADSSSASAPSFGKRTEVACGLETHDRSK
jgi:hypothetical protein